MELVTGYLVRGRFILTANATEDDISNGVPVLPTPVLLNQLLHQIRARNSFRSGTPSYHAYQERISELTELLFRTVPSVFEMREGGEYLSRMPLSEEEHLALAIRGLQFDNQRVSALTPERYQSLQHLLPMKRVEN